LYLGYDYVMLPKVLVQALIKLNHFVLVQLSVENLGIEPPINIVDAYFKIILLVTTILIIKTHNFEIVVKLNRLERFIFEFLKHILEK
jgi:hypothetical protein